jgi:hypothetical protein
VIEECAKVAENEPELPGEPPLEVAHIATELRATVRVTKQCIAERIRALKGNNKGTGHE